MRMTKHRTEIMTALASSTEALSARALHHQLPHINLVTIYRNLEHFTTTGAVKKLTFDAQETLYEIQDEPHHHALCTTCGSVIHFTFPQQELAAEFDLPGFSVQDVEVTVRGVCSKHRSGKQPRTKS